MVHRSLLALFVIVIWACGSKSPSKSEQKSEQKATNPSNNTEVLYNFLKEQSGKHILFGHQDALAYGVNWKYEKGRTDVADLVGDQPAIYGWDIGQLHSKENLDSVPFDWMRTNIIESFHQGAITTISWHTFSPIDNTNSWKIDEPIVRYLLPDSLHHEAYKKQLDKVALFLNSLQTDKGVKVPIIFRPFHENNGDWFWWGEKHCTVEEYKTLYRFTIEYLKAQGTDNMLVAYSPDRMFDTESDYLKRYPGDDIIDIIGMDDYYDFKVEGGDSLVAKRLTIVSQLAQKKQKVAAFSETGCEAISDSTWYTQRLLKALKANEDTKKIAYVLVWRNYSKKHHYVPYAKDHPAAPDFIQFYQDSLTVFHSQAIVPYIQ